MVCLLAELQAVASLAPYSVRLRCMALHFPPTLKHMQRQSNLVARKGTRSVCVTGSEAGSPAVSWAWPSGLLQGPGRRQWRPVARAAKQESPARSSKRSGKGRVEESQVDARSAVLSAMAQPRRSGGRQQTGEEEEDSEEENWTLKIGDEDLEEGAGSALPSPPAGFVVEGGEVVLMAPPEKRTLTMVDPELGRSLECLVRRTFLGAQGLRFFVLIPLDTPVQVLRIDPDRGMVVELEDGEVEQVFPSAAYALAKKSMHLLQTGFCLTARGALCYTEAAVINLETEYGLGILGNLGEGVEICKFITKGAEYIVYTPFDPLLFVAYEDESGQIRLAESDELLSDPKVEAAVAEEQEFNDMVDEEEDIMEAIRVAASSKKS